MSSAGRLEICVDSFESAANAVNGGANQLEVCSALSLGGLTPSIGLVRRIRAAFPFTPLFVMLRPRGGDFIYSEDEFEVMQEDLRAMKQIGVAGFVFGILDSSGGLDIARNKRLIQLSLPLPSTLHRAFDFTKEWRKAVEDAVNLGFKFILTSGQAATAMEGLTRLKKIRTEANGNINIIVGSGVTSKTLPTLLTDTGCSWFHGSASVPVQPKVVQNGFMVGTHDTHVQRVTDKEEVRKMKDLLRDYFGSHPLSTPYY